MAIIAILAAIAVPNFLEAQTRAKVSRVHADMRTIATAIESYMVDYASIRQAGLMHGTKTTMPVWFLIYRINQGIYSTNPDEVRFASKGG